MKLTRVGSQLTNPNPLPTCSWYEQREYDDGAPRAPTCSAESTPLGSDVAPHLCAAYLMKTGADICIDNAGNIRSDISSGDFTDEKLDAMFKYDNDVVVVEVSGADIVAALEEAVESGIPGYIDWLNEVESESGTGQYPYAAGLRFDADISSSAGAERVSNVQVKSESGAWTDIDPAAMYKVAATAFVAGVGSFEGKGYYPALAAGAGTASSSFGVAADIFKEYVTNVGTLEKLPQEEYSTQSFTADPPAGDDSGTDIGNSNPPGDESTTSSASFTGLIYSLAIGMLSGLVSIM